MLIQRGYKTEIDPNDKQRTLLMKNAGAARYAYNWGLKIKQQAMQDKTKLPTAVDLHREINKLKKTDIQWAYECSKCSFQEALRNLDSAFNHFFRKCKLKKEGKFKGKVGFPKKKSRKKCIGSFRLTGSIKVSETHVQLPRIGKMKLKERGYIPTNSKVLSAVVSEHAGRWFVSVQVEETLPEPAVKNEGKVGVDLGIKTLAVPSKGKPFENPKALKKNLKKLKRLGRWVSRKEKGKKNRKKAARRLGKLHYRIACIRKDALHKITSELTKTKSRIVIEDLNVSGMLKNHCLAQAIQDVGLYEFRRQLEYKGNWYGCEIVKADRFFPSSKMCSGCGNIKKDLKLSDRTYRCDCCDLVIDRDLNAAINLENYSTDSSSETGRNANAFGEGSSGFTHVSRVKLPSLN